MMPKTEFQQLKLQQFLAGKNFTDGNFFLGMLKIKNQWLWDDGSPVFTQCKLDQNNYENDFGRFLTHSSIL